MRRAPALLLLLTATACRPDCSSRRPDAPPNVVLVTIDTLRADHVGAYGGTRAETPHLDRLAAEGLLLERAYSLTHITIPSHVTIMSSVPMVAHGIEDNKTATPRPVTVLPALFRRAGYRTAAFASAIHLGPGWPLGALLAPHVEVYEVPRRASRPHIGEETNRRVFRWLRGACRDPFFAWVHYWDPHAPYTPPPGFDGRYYRGGDPRDPRHTSLLAVQHNWFMHDMRRFRRRLAPHAAALKRLKRTYGLSSRQVRALVLSPTGRVAALEATPAGRAALRARIRAISLALRAELPLRRHVMDFLDGIRDAEFPLAQYAAEVTYVDTVVGALRAELERLELTTRTVLLVTADHGESLGEHGLWFTHHGLTEPNVRIPMIVWAPGHVAPARRRDRATTLDVAPTLLALAGLPIPPTMMGRSLTAAAPPTDAPVVGEAMGRAQLSILAGDWKLIRTVRDLYYTDAYERAAGAVELFDLSGDPAEARNRATIHPAEAARLGAALDDWLAGHAAPRERGGALSRAQLEQLRALGYVE